MSHGEAVRWVTKSIHHKKVGLYEGNGGAIQPTSGATLQMLVANPLLIDQRQFDIGLYTLLRVGDDGELSIEVVTPITV